MQLKFLKFLVVFMGILIIVGIILLAMSIYNKMQTNTRNYDNTKSKNIVISKPLGMKFVSHSINKRNMILNYEDSKKLKIIIFDLSQGKKIKEIEVLK